VDNGATPSLAVRTIDRSPGRQPRSITEAYISSNAYGDTAAGASRLVGQAVPQLVGHLERVADREPHPARVDAGVDRVVRAQATEFREHMIVRDRCGPQRAEVSQHERSEFGQSHAAMLPPRPADQPPAKAATDGLTDEGPANECPGERITHR
jgi:hypothetical protein